MFLSKTKKIYNNFFFGKHLYRKKDKDIPMKMFFLLFAAVAAQHAWHFFNTTNPANCQLANVLENSATFVDAFDNVISQFQTTDSFVFAINLNPNATFNMIYSLACFESACKLRPCSRCVFELSALAPQHPVVHISNYGSAIGSWQFIGNQTIILLTINFT